MIYKATVTVLVEAEDEGNACDFLAESFREWNGNGLLDWSYVRGSDGLHTVPVKTDINPTDYEEGEGFD